jgi:hypothetical protein
LYKVRRWSVRHAGFLEGLYGIFEGTMVRLDPVFRLLGYRRVEKPITMVESAIKGFLFDCHMCGQCVLNATGMSCPMNCPKRMRNGPCGGVRQDGSCEVLPDMRCVWVDAFEGSRQMRGSGAIQTVQFAVDSSLEGSSSWLRMVREKARARTADQEVVA